MQISMARSKRWLTIIWFAGAALLFFVMLLQTIFGHYGTRWQEAWEWFLPTIMPTLSLVVGVLVIDAQGKGVKTRTTSKLLYYLALFLSIGYLLVVASILLLQPIAWVPPLELMQQSSLALAAIQSLVTGCLGAFFVKSE